MKNVIFLYKTLDKFLKYFVESIEGFLKFIVGHVFKKDYKCIKLKLKPPS